MSRTLPDPADWSAERQAAFLDEATENELRDIIGWMTCQSPEAWASAVRHIRRTRAARQDELAAHA